jgi:hypothetical protein
MVGDLGAEFLVMNANDLMTELAHFTGTESYHRLMPRLLITDGVGYLANRTGSYWLLSAIYSHLTTKSIESEFVVARLIVDATEADLLLDDGNGDVISHQHIDYTDFPLIEMKIYCVYQERSWLLVLPSEY